MEKQKRKWGDRKDGIWLKDIPAMNRIMPGLMPNRADNEAYINVDIDARPMNEYLANIVRNSYKEDPISAFYDDNNTYSFVSCPTCGRCKVNLIEIATEVEKGLESLAKTGYFTRPISVAVMGCAVNGPGEAKAADIGLAGGDGCALMFENGEIKGKLYGDNIAGQFIEKVKEYYERV